MYRKEWAKDYYRRTKEIRDAKAKEYYAHNRERINEQKRARRLLEGKRPRERKWDTKNEEQRARTTQRKKIVLIHYGNVCVCCKEKNSKFLTIDHINNDGKRHGYHNGRRKTGSALYAVLIAEGFPDDVRILCFNCNVGRHLNGGRCPHEEQ